MQPNDYSFLNSPATVKPGPSKKQRIMVVAGGGTVLLIVLLIGWSLLFGGGGDSAATSLKLAQMHTELIRVSEIGKDKSRGQNAKNLATTTHLTLLSDEAAIIAIANSDQKVSDKLLRAGQDVDTDDTLTEAEQRSRFDEVFVPLIVEEIKEYQAELQRAFEASKSKRNRETYEKLFLNLNKIVKAAELSQ